MGRFSPIGYGAALALAVSACGGGGSQGSSAVEEAPNPDVAEPTATEPPASSDPVDVEPGSTTSPDLTTDPVPPSPGEPPTTGGETMEEPEVSNPTTPEVDPTDPAEPTEPGETTNFFATWHGAIAPLVISKCSGCHRAGGIGPFSLETYQDAVTLAPLLQAAIDLKVMPPWGAHETDECQPRFGFKDDLRLSDEEIALFGAWVEAGTPEGNPETAVAIPSPPSLTLDDADLSLPMPEVSIEPGADRFLCFSLDPGLDADAWVTAAQVVPGNPAIVHHVLTYVDTAGESAALANEDGYYECFGGPGLSETTLLGAWAPGGVPFRAPEGVALTIPAGSRLVVNVHYHPTGAGTETDAGTRIDFAFSQTEPVYDGQMLLIGNFSGSGALGSLLPGDSDPESGPEFVIPAGAQGHVETMTFTVPPIGVPEGILWGVGTHMHYVGTDMLMTLTRSSGGDQPAEECLLQTPRWDFNWQRGYRYDAPLAELPTAGPGDVLGFRCTYDNSMENPFVREALDEQGLTEPRDVRLGEESLDEMCLGVFAVAYPR